MTQCANTQITACTGNGSFTIDLTDIYQFPDGNLSIDNVSIFPSATTYTPGQSFALLGGTATVQANGISWSGPTGATSNQQLNVCATDNSGQLCCTFNLVFNPNCTDGGTVGDCLSFTDTNLVGSTLHEIFPGDVHGSQTAFASPAIVGEVDPDNCIIVVNDQTDVVRYRCTAECSGATLTLELANGETCDATINCQDQVTNSLTCITSSMAVSPSQILDGSAFVTGGTAPYTVTATSNGFTSVTSGDLAIGAGLTNGQSFSSNVTVQDSIGTSETCTVQFTVSATTVDCIVISDSSILATPSSATPGQNVVITANVNQSTGGLAGYYLRVRDSSGNYLSDPAYVSGATWTWTVPTVCTDGTYSIEVNPPVNSGCPVWSSAETFGVTGCDTGGGECNSTLSDVICPTISGSTTPGSVQTVTFSTDMCNCDGFQIEWLPGRNTGTVANPIIINNPRTISINNANTHNPSFIIPATAQAGEEYHIYPTCCPG